MTAIWGRNVPKLSALTAGPRYLYIYIYMLTSGESKALPLYVHPHMYIYTLVLTWVYPCTVDVHLIQVALQITYFVLNSLLLLAEAILIQDGTK